MAKSTKRRYLGIDPEPPITDADDADIADVLPPDQLQREDQADDLPAEAGVSAGQNWLVKQRLQTPGQIKAELGRVYRKIASGQIGSKRGLNLTRTLATMLKAAELELQFQLKQDDPNDDLPVFTGLTLIGPTKPPDAEKAPTAAAGGTSARRGK